MPDFTQPIEMSFILESIGAIFALITIGILLVKIRKKAKNS